MDSDDEVYICEQSDHEDDVGINHTLQESNFKNSPEENLNENDIDDDFLKECQDFLENMEDKNKTKNCIEKDKSNISIKLEKSIEIKQSPIVNERKRKTPCSQKKLNPLMRNALKQSKAQASLLETIPKMTKIKPEIKVPENECIELKKEAEPGKCRSTICIDISEAPPIKVKKAKISRPINIIPCNISKVKPLDSFQNNKSISLDDNSTIDRRNANVIISSIKKQFGCSKEEAVRRFVEKCREENQKEGGNKFMEDKAHFLRTEMPWVPFLNIGKINDFTNIPEEDHKRYVAIIMNLIQQNPEFRFAHNKNELAHFDEKLKVERALFYKIVFDKYDKRNKNPYQFCLPNWKAMAFNLAEARSKDLGNFDYENFDVIYNYENGTNIEPLPLSILSVSKQINGDGPCINLPDLRKKCIFDSKIVYQKKVYYNVNKLTDDKNAMNISSDNDARILMDATTFSRLLIGRWGCNDLKYSFPISVTKRFVGGNLENFVTFLKPIPSSKSSRRTLAYKIMKYVVKGGINRKYFDKPASIKEQVEDVSIPEAPLSPSYGKISSDELSSFNEKEKSPVAKRDSVYCGKVYHVLNLNANTSYSNFNVLIRANCAEVDNFGNKLAVFQHVEYFPEVGAENLFREELVHNYIKSFFKDADHAVIFRVHSSTCNVLQKEFIKINHLESRIRSECLDIWKKGLQRVRSILMKLLTVDGGEYLLEEEDDDTFKLYSGIDKELDTECSDLTNRFCELIRNNNIDGSSVLKDERKPSSIFNGISIHVPLMWHFVTSRIPGSLPKKKTIYCTNNDNKNKQNNKRNDYIKKEETKNSVVEIY
uniref:NARG2_C domain-containing protein n=1 Tax=Parastrongyloides trichosuri TaxID=131310 RepID=A0A0N4ZS27_PARTI